MPRPAARCSRASHRPRGILARAATVLPLALLLWASPGRPLVAQAAPPMVVYRSFLDMQFFLSGPEAAIKEHGIMLAFAPADPVSATVRVRRGAAVLQELPARVTNRAGTMALLTYRATGVKLGDAEGERTIDVVVNGQLAGQFTFTLRKRSTGDAFDNTVQWEVDGPWRSHMHLEYDPTASAPQRVYARFWSSLAEMPGGQRGRVELRGRRGGRTLFTSYATPISAPGFQGFTVEAVVGADRIPWSAEKLAGQDGPLTIELVNNGVVLRTFETRIEKGTFAAHAQSAVPPADPLHFLSPRLVGSRGFVSTNHVFWLTR